MDFIDRLKNLFNPGLESQNIGGLPWNPSMEGQFQNWSRQTPDQDEITKLISILQQHSNKNFVQRLLKPDLYPNIGMGPKGPGTTGTHLMGSAMVDGEPIVFPEIVQKPGEWNLTRLDPRTAIEYAIKNNEYIPMSSPEEAEWFGRRYKKVWGY